MASPISKVLAPIVRLLGQRHVKFGVKNEDYAKSERRCSGP